MKVLFLNEMSKRYVPDSEINSNPPTKKCKLEISKETASSSSIKTKNVQSTTLFNDDIWGDDFAADEIKEMDNIASQVEENSQTVAVCPLQVIKKTESTVNINNIPSTSNTFKRHNLKDHIVNMNLVQSTNTGVKSQNSMYNSNPINKRPFVKTKSDQSFNYSKVYQPSQILAGSNRKNDTFLNSQANYTEFKQHHLPKSDCNSTLRILDASINVKKKEDLVQQNKELLNSFRQKEGEVEFLRRKLKTLETQVDKEKTEKNRLVKEVEEKYKVQIESLNKEKSDMKTQLELQSFEMRNVTERFKNLETGSIKLSQPQPAVPDPPFKSKLNSSFVRNDTKSSSVNTTVKETSFRLLMCDKIKLGVSMNHCPLLNEIPPSIFEASLPEKPVVDIQIVEKSGRRNLPILQEEQTFRIFENPELVKPLVTMINKEELNCKFYLPDLAKIINKSESEINAMDTIPIINKIVVTTRELLLNSTIVLQKISEVMTNDDIRDMNDTYFSSVYKTPVFHSKTVCDGNAWHEKERGIEAKRSLGVLSYITLHSTYLSRYIAGINLLVTEDDPDYQKYSMKMTSYESWSFKNSEYEFLELLLKFVTAVRSVRRAHQFIGLISAIVMTLTNAQERVGFDETGIRYAFKILKEIVLSRPLLQCYIPITQMVKVFGECPLFTKNLCNFTKKTSFEYLQLVMHFKPDACILEIFIKQMEQFALDPITTIKITSALITFANTALSRKMMFRSSKLLDNCPVAQLVLFIVKLLHDCSQINIDALKLVSSDKKTEPTFSLNNVKLFQEDWTTFSDAFWENIKSGQIHVLKKGIHFLNFLLAHDPDLIRLPDLELPFSKLLQQVSNKEDFVLGINETEATCNLKKVFVTNDTLRQIKSELKLDIRNRYKKR